VRNQFPGVSSFCGFLSVGWATYCLLIGSFSVEKQCLSGGWMETICPFFRERQSPPPLGFDSRLRVACGFFHLYVGLPDLKCCFSRRGRSPGGGLLTAWNNGVVHMLSKDDWEALSRGSTCVFLVVSNTGIARGLDGPRRTHCARSVSDWCLFNGCFLLIRDGFFFVRRLFLSRWLVVVLSSGVEFWGLLKQKLLFWSVHGVPSRMPLFGGFSVVGPPPKLCCFVVSAQR